MWVLRCAEAVQLGLMGLVVRDVGSSGTKGLNMLLDCSTVLLLVYSLMSHTSLPYEFVSSALYGCTIA